METLKLDRQTAIQLYPNAAPEFREMLNQTFGVKTFITDVCQRVQTLEDAYRETGDERLSLSDSYKQAEHEIEVFAKALREGKPAGECFYYPFFYRSAGGGFSYYDYGDGRGCSRVGARLRVPDSKTAKHLGNVMIDRYKTMDKG